MADGYTTPTDESPETDTPEGLFEQLKGWYRQDMDGASEWREKASSDYDFAAPGGEKQWDAAVKALREEKGLPTVAFNRILPVTQAVVGMAINDRKEVTYKPRTTSSATLPGQVDPVTGQPTEQPVPGGDDQGPAETFTAGYQYLRDQCEAKNEETDAFQDTVVCGMGWVETTVSYDENPDGQLKYDRIDPLEMLWDCKSQKRNLADSRRNWWVREIDVQEAKEQFGKEPYELDAAWARLANYKDPHDSEAARNYENNEAVEWDPARKTVTMVHCEYKVREVGYRAANPQTGEVIDIEKSQIKQLKENARAAGVQIEISKQPKTVYYTAILGRDVISWDKSQSQKAFARQCITGYRDRNAREWVGLVRPMRGPQQWANVLMSSVLHQIQTSGKGVVMEKDAVDDVQKAEKDWANASRIVWVKTGALGQHPKFKQKEQNSIPAGTMDMMQFALGSLRDVTGVNIEAMGLADRQQAASLEYQRRQAATTILAPFFEGFSRYVVENGKLGLDLMRQLLADGRLIRVVGPDYEQYVPLLADDDTIEYDIIIDESPSSPNQKEASWLILQQLLPVIGRNLTPGTLGKLMKASPLPESVVDDFVEAAEKEAQSAPPPPEMIQMQMQQQQQQFDQQIAAQKAEQESAKMQVDIQIKGVDLQIELAKLEQMKLKTVADLQMGQMNMQAQAEQRQFDQASNAMKLQGDAEQRAFDRESAEADRNFQMRKGEQEMATKRMEIGGKLDTEMAKNPEAMGHFGAIGKGLEALAAAIAESNKAMAAAMSDVAQGQAVIGQALMAPKVAQLSADGMTATVSAR